MNFYALSFLDDVYNEVYEHMQRPSELRLDHNIVIIGL